MGFRIWGWLLSGSAEQQANGLAGFCLSVISILETYSLIGSGSGNMDSLLLF